ncbi:hypothetical protein MKW98_009960 [Papaver atlanticum]|uniref:Uncharacterized protein n=1 Tax=Papaver atlanticum TaxID=357466 RepID=A0AAD4XQK8_9MAGN|nr:hypothetical protein MKW98_009960 [Papaver atlanticum]
MNTDASFIKGNFIAGLAQIIRDFSGTLVGTRILAAISWKAEKAEAWVMLEVKILTNVAALCSMPLTKSFTASELMAMTKTFHSFSGLKSE